MKHYEVESFTCRVQLQMATLRSERLKNVRVVSRDWSKVWHFEILLFRANTSPLVPIFMEILIFSRILLGIPSFSEVSTSKYAIIFGARYSYVSGSFHMKSCMWHSDRSNVAPTTSKQTLGSSRETVEYCRATKPTNILLWSRSTKL